MFIWRIGINICFLFLTGFWSKNVDRTSIQLSKYFLQHYQGKSYFSSPELNEKILENKGKSGNTQEKLIYKAAMNPVAMHTESTQNNKFAISLQCLKENLKEEIDFFACRKTSKASSNWHYHFWSVWQGMSKLPKISSMLFLCNDLRKNWVMKLIFPMQISMKVSYKLILRFWLRWSSISKVPKTASLQCLYIIS